MGSSGADSADSIDATQSLDAPALLRRGVVDFVGPAFLGADAELVGVVSIFAVASAGGFVED